MSAYAEVRRKNADSAGSAPQHYTCCRCERKATHAELAAFGAMCSPCYESYCREPWVQQERSNAALRIRAEIEALGRRLPA